MDTNNLIIEEIRNITVRLEKIENNIERNNKEISLRLDKIEKGTDNMNNHISFIDNIYENVKYPFYLLLNRFHKIDKIPEKKQIEL